MSDSKFPVKDTYNKFLEEQEALEQKLNQEKDKIKEFLDDVLSKKDEIKFKAYNDAVNNIERVRNGMDEKIKYMNDIIPKMIENSTKNKESLDEVNKVLDEFMKKFNEAKISTLEDLLRIQLKSIPKEKLKSLSLKIKTVLDKTYGGRKRKTLKRFRN